MGSGWGSQSHRDELYFSERVCVLGIWKNLIWQSYQFRRHLCWYVNMFLILKWESSVYPSWVQSEADKTNTSRTIGAQKELLYTRHRFQKCGPMNFGKTKMKRCWENGLKSKTILRQLFWLQWKCYTSFWQIRVLSLQTSYSRTTTWYEYPGNGG